MVFNATFNNISVMADSFIGGGDRKNHRLCRKSLFCHLQSRARTHAVLVIDLYELLGNPTT
jgi:hypothetical protein